MLRSTEVRREIASTKREMKACGIMKVSCFNGGLDSQTYQANSKLFRLSNALKAAIEAERKEAENV